MDGTLMTLILRIRNDFFDGTLIRLILRIGYIKKPFLSSVFDLFYLCHRRSNLYFTNQTLSLAPAVIYRCS
jgi:hypothetical protein